jgi:hypothetical protein
VRAAYAAVKDILILTLLALGVVLCCVAIQTLDHVERMTATMQESQRHVQAATLNTLKNLNDTAAEARKSVALFNTQTLPRINGTLAAAQSTVETVNKTLPVLAADSHAALVTANKALADTDKSITELAGETGTALAETQRAVAEAVKTEQAAQALLADPVMVGNLRHASTNLSKSTEPLPDIVANIDAQEKSLTHVVAHYERMLTAPASKAKAVVTTVINWIKPPLF